MKEERIFEELEDFIEKSWFYDNEEPNLKVINADYLKNFIKWLKNQ